MTTAHEVSYPGPHTETVMDLINNAAGVEAEDYCEHWPATYDCCRETIQDLVSAGNLCYLDSSHGSPNTDEDALLQPTDE